MNHPKKFVNLLEKLIQDGRNLLKSSSNGRIEDREGLRRWSNELILLRTMGGDMISPWVRRLTNDGCDNYNDSVEYPLAALETVKYAIDEGLLCSYRELIMAEAFADLYEQGQHLLAQGYFLAAGVIFRAVLEEKLRELCMEVNCMPVEWTP